GEKSKDRDQLDRETRPRELVAEAERSRLPEEEVTRLADEGTGRDAGRGRERDDRQRSCERRHEEQGDEHDGRPEGARLVPGRERRAAEQEERGAAEGPDRLL